MSTQEITTHMLKIIDDWDQEDVVLAEYAGILGMMQTLVKHFDGKLHNVAPIKNATDEALKLFENQEQLRILMNLSRNADQVNKLVPFCQYERRFHKVINEKNKQDRGGDHSDINKGSYWHSFRGRSRNQKQLNDYDPIYWRLSSQMLYFQWLGEIFRSIAIDRDKELHVIVKNVSKKVLKISQSSWFRKLNRGSFLKSFMLEQSKEQMKKLTKEDSFEELRQMGELAVQISEKLNQTCLKHSFNEFLE